MALCSDDKGSASDFECRTFKKHFADLSECIQSPTTLAGRLYSADLLSRDTRRTICSLEKPGQQTTELLDAVEGQIRLDPQNFYKFVDVLEKDRPIQPLCDKLRSTCAQLKSTQPVSSMTLPPNTSVTRNEYRVFLKDCYRQPLPDDDKLLATASKHYIELAVISRKSITRKEADDFTKKSLHGLTEEILHKKTPIALKDILKPREDGRPVRCVLVEGAPGIGKSTLAWEVCHKWEELDSVKQYELVLLVHLREKKAQEARYLEDLLPCDAITNINELVATLGRGKGVLIVCDGFDELPHTQQQEGSVYIDLLKGRLLPEATVIVTSRPSVSASLWSLCQHNIDRHLEVIGFTKEEIKRFAKSVFSGDILEGFLSYITSNPPIYSMMYIPLNAVIVALIYQDSYDTDTPFPTTMTQLFDALTRALIRRHLVSTHQVPTDFCMPTHLNCMEEMTNLPSLVSQQVLNLARVAFEGVCKKIYVFSDLGESFEQLGMMKKTTSLKVWAGRKSSYSFLHLTLQEYMAALHIAIMSSSDFHLLKSVLAKEEHTVVRFLAGICANSSHSLHKNLATKLLAKIQHDSLKLVQCAYECPSIMRNVKVDYSNRDAIVVEPVVGADWYITGYCISHFNETWGLVFKNETDENVDLLVKGLRSYSVAEGSIQVIDMFSSCFSLSQIFTQLKIFCQLKCLRLIDLCSTKDDDIVILKQLIAGSGLRKLVYYSTATYTDKLISLFFHCSSLEELTIKVFQRLNIRTEHLPVRNTNLKKLTIPCPLIQPLAKMLPNITSLTYLEITGDVSDSDLPVLANIVQSHPMLEVLVLPHMLISPNLLVLLIEAAAGNSQLRKLVLDKYSYDSIPHHLQQLITLKTFFIPV